MSSGVNELPDGSGFFTGTILTGEDAQTRKQQIIDQFGSEEYRQVWCHAACGSIALGFPGWEECLDESASIVDVKNLRRNYETLVKKHNALLDDVKKMLSNPDDKEANDRVRDQVILK